MGITKEMSIGDILRLDEGLAPILVRAGMNCVGCPAAQGESLAEAALVHGMDAEALVTEMNAYMESVNA